MGAIYISRRSNTNGEGILKQQGFGACEQLDVGSFSLRVYPRQQDKRALVQPFQGDDFIAAAGSMIRRGARDRDALKGLYDNFAPDGPPVTDALGMYALVIHKDGRTFITPDALSAFPIFYNPSTGSVSTSFLALAAEAPRLTVTDHGAAEYILNGAIVGDETLVSEIVRVPLNAVLELTKDGIRLHQRPVAVPAPDQRSRADLLAEATERLDRYVAAVLAAYDGRVSCPITGGYDSRLLLALATKQNAEPRALVYGDGDINVQVAQAVSKAAAVPLEVISQSRSVAVADFPERVHRNYLTSDGYFYTGAFDAYVEHDDRFDRTIGDTAFLEGGGGEVFRNFFLLRDRPYTARQLAEVFFARFHRGVLPPTFDFGAYLDRLASKIERLTGRTGRLDRQTIEWLYPNLRCRAWFGRQNGFNNWVGPSFMPYYDAPVTSMAERIPVKHKASGSFEAELIRIANPTIAAVTSQYGHNFASRPPLKRRAVDWAKTNVPPKIRPWLYDRRQRHRGGSARRGVYVSPDYTGTVLPDGPEQVSRLLRTDAMTDDQMLSRALTVEYFLQQHAGTARTEWGR